MLGKMNKELKNIFVKGVHAVNPSQLIKSIVSRDTNNSLNFHNNKCLLNNNCYVIGFGKAAYEMAVEVESIIGEHLQKGIISVPIGIKTSRKIFLKNNSVIKVIEGGKNNLPDECSFKAAQEIKILAENLTFNDILIVLISGGGSALLSYPIPPISINEKLKTIQALSFAGADITELNCVRKVLSVLKGGKLALLTYPAEIISLILSDIIGDPLDLIASGPTVLTNNSSEDAIQILKKYNVLDKVPESVKQVLYDKHANNIKLENKYFEVVHNIIIGNNLTSLMTSKKEAEFLQYFSVILSSRINGLVSDVALVYSELIRCVIQFLSQSVPKDKILINLKNMVCCFPNNSGISDIVNTIIENIDIIKINNADKKLCLIAGGEPTVKLKGGGKGGRNQELALEMSIRLHELKNTYECIQKYNISFLSAGTDGIDGPTDAAGAISYDNLVHDAFSSNLDPKKYLENNDSYSFFQLFNNNEQLIMTGHTGTNVMDLHIISIVRK